MRVCVTLLLLLGLDRFRQPAVVRAQPVHVVTEGETITVDCQVSRNPIRYNIFCKNTCDKGDILVKSRGHKRCQGRFCIEPQSWFGMTVSIANVTRFDAGQYQCGPGESEVNEIFWIEVTKPKTTSPPHTTGPSIPPEELNTSELLLLILVPVVLIIISALIYYRKRKSRKNNRTTINSEVVLYENCPFQASKHADSIYQTLSADTRDHNNIYSSLNTQPPSH